MNKLKEKDDKIEDNDIEVITNKKHKKVNKI